MKKYLIQGKQLEQRPLVIGQVRQLLKLLEDLELTENSRFAEMVDVLIGEKLPELMRIIFGEAAAEVDWETVPYDTLDEVVTDFFELNPRLISRLKSLLTNLTPLAAKPTP